MLVGLPVSSMVYLLACRSLDIEKEWELGGGGRSWPRAETGPGSEAAARRVQLYR